MYRIEIHFGMIKSFRHKGLQQFFETGSKAGIAAKAPQEMNVIGWKLHPLKGELANHWAVKVNGNWRLTFTFEGEDAILIDYQDYH